MSQEETVKDVQDTDVKKETTVEKTQEDSNKTVLLGSISYENEEEYTQWLAKMDVNQAIFVLVAGANFSQAKGAFNIAESELISAAIRAIKKNSTPPTEAPDAK